MDLNFLFFEVELVNHNQGFRNRGTRRSETRRRPHDSPKSQYLWFSTFCLPNRLESF